MDKQIKDLIKKTFPKMTEKERLAFGIAFGAHTSTDQRDKAALEYIIHPLTVYLNCDTEDEKVVALLHDVVEDTKITLDDLNMLFEPHIIEAIKLISHPKDNYDRQKYFDDIKANPIARKVKLEDLRTNMDRSRILSLLEWYDYMVESRYKKEFEYLLND